MRRLFIRNENRSFCFYCVFRLLVAFIERVWLSRELAPA